MASTVADFPLTGLGAAKISTIPLEGRLEGTSVPEILCALSREAFSGALMLERRGLRKVLYLREGRVVFAASSDPEDRLGTFLLRRGEVRLAPLLEASGQVARGRRLGQILVDSGVMDPGAVVRAVLDQVREVALSVFAFREGGYKLSRVSLPAHESITLDLPMETLVLTGVKRVRDWRWVRKAVGGPRAVYRRTEGSQLSLASLGMTERAVLEQLQRPCRVDTLCREVYAPSYDVYRSLWGLAIIGAIEREDPRLITGFISSPTEGFLPQGGAIEILLELGARRFSGVLRLFQDGLEGALFFESGRVQFATTNDPEKSLVTHLLRRGVISDRDHDDAVRRLLSGKRIGTILAERGALQPEDVERFVREQLMDVARSLTQWRDGEFTLEEGVNLSESVRLDASVEDVVVEACTALEVFDQLWDELGGLGTLFRLRRDYLDRLDRMALRPTIWELVSLLGQERTVEELLASRPEPDFELARLIYALDRVGVVERVSEAEILVRAREVKTAVPTYQDSTLLAEHEARADAAAHFAEPPSNANALDFAPELFSRQQRELAPPTLEDLTANELGDGSAEPLRSEGEAAHEAAADATWFSEAVPSEDPIDPSADPSEHSDLSPEAEFSEAPGATAWNASEPVPNAAEPSVPESALRDESLEGLPASASIQTSEADLSREESFVEGPATDYGSEEVEVAPAAPIDLDTTLETERPNVDASQTLEIPRSMIADALNTVPPSESHSFDTPQRHDDELSAFDGTDQAGEVAPWEPSGETSSHEQSGAELETQFDPASSSPLDEVETPEVPALTIPDTLFAEVDRFNRRHALLFHEIRLEIGAGARNFVLTCARRLGPYGVVFAGLEPDRAGIFDRELLARAVLERWGGDPTEALDSLIDVELNLVGDLMSLGRRATLLQALRSA
ncbi:MAG: DUF4388 domain-containing protein [Acidobacteriota bacterium]